MYASVKSPRNSKNTQPDIDKKITVHNKVGGETNIEQKAHNYEVSIRFHLWG
jgi:hypothetical protein